MRYLFLICSDGIPTAQKTAAMQAHAPAWVQETDASGARLYGRQLERADAAKTVMVREGQTLISDGPFAESKEFVAGVDLIDAADLDEAIEIAARHPVAQFHSVEIRPLTVDPPVAGDSGLPDPDLLQNPRPGSERYMMFICVDGVPESEAVESQIVRDMKAWSERLTAGGHHVYGHPLAPPDAATTVRVREGQTLISDGPFVEAKEFIAGFTIDDFGSEREALEMAAQNPIAAFHRIEVRRFARDPGED